MTEREGAQERPQRQRRPHPGKQPAHRAVTQQRHVVDGIGTGDHPRDQAPDLQMRVDTASLPERHMPGDQRRQTGPLSERQDRRQTGAGQQVGVIEDRGESMRNSVGATPMASALVKNALAAGKFRRVESMTSMTWPCWSTAR
jgi:hypothetical protein